MKFFPYFYRVTVDRVIDGDTVVALFDLGFNITHRVTVRLAGYDAPETYRPKTEAEAQAGVHCADKLSTLLRGYTESLYCRSTKIDLYGRSTGIFYVKEHRTDEYISLNDHMAEWIKNHGYTKAELRK